MSINQLSSLQLELLTSFALNRSDEDLLKYYKMYIATQSKYALAKTIAKEECLILE